MKDLSDFFITLEKGDGAILMVFHCLQCGKEVLRFPCHPHWMNKLRHRIGMPARTSHRVRKQRVHLAPP